MVVSDDEYINSIKYLIENEILVIEEEKPIDDRGDFYITYMENPNTPFESSSRDWLINTEYLEIQRDFLNELFSLPYDVEILATECGDENMFYDWELKQIIFVMNSLMGYMLILLNTMKPILRFL